MIKKENMVYILEGVEERLKEKSKAYGEFYIDKLAYMKFLETHTATEEEVKKFEEIFEVLEKEKNDKKREYKFKTLEKVTKALVNKVGEIKQTKESLEFAEKSLKDLGEFIEVVLEAKEDLKK